MGPGVGMLTYRQWRIVLGVTHRHEQALPLLDNTGRADIYAGGTLVRRVHLDPARGYLGTRNDTRTNLDGQRCAATYLSAMSRDTTSDHLESRLTLCRGAHRRCAAAAAAGVDRGRVVKGPAVRTQYVLAVARRSDGEDGALGAEQDFLCGAAEQQLADWAAMAKADDDQIRALVGRCLQDVIGRAVSSDVFTDAVRDAVVSQSSIGLVQAHSPGDDVLHVLVATAGRMHDN
jgi:hypothetical protein